MYAKRVEADFIMTNNPTIKVTIDKLMDEYLEEIGKAERIEMDAIFKLKKGLKELEKNVK